ncbi:MAG: glutaredoxin family protein [Gammaproteobacteria bacterium HGW-Gammaproteobacteria-14]|nr:MAG: glutaredoxin family protein [Gammaproteobacteria bacterium HGW-Gammaproteobacteria-14]
MTTELLTTEGCHLCEHALEIIHRVAPGVKLALVDIAEEDALIERYGEKIPVLRNGSHELCWPFNFLDVQAFFANVEPSK